MANAVVITQTDGPAKASTPEKVTPSTAQTLPPIAEQTLESIARDALAKGAPVQVLPIGLRIDH